MKVSTVASLATIGSAFGAPQVKPPVATQNATDEWADYNYIAANIATLLPEVMALKEPGGKE
jgi:hypothetical protein